MGICTTCCRRYIYTANVGLNGERLLLHVPCVPQGTKMTKYISTMLAAIDSCFNLVRPGAIVLTISMLCRF